MMTHTKIIYGHFMASPIPDALDRRTHRGPFRFLYMDFRTFLRRYLGWG